MSDTATPTKGLRLSVLRHAGPDCTNNGITARHDELTLVGVRDDKEATWGKPAPTVAVPREARVFAPDDRAAAVILVVRHIGGATMCLVPAVHDGRSWVEAPGWHMAGGRFAATPDSRFGAILREAGLSSGYVAVAVHDRKE